MARSCRRWSRAQDRDRRFLAGLVRIHPDGRHIVFAMSKGGSNTEVWAMENILPALKAGS